MSADELINNMLSDIFKDVDFRTLDKYQKSFLIYNYLTTNINFNQKLWIAIQQWQQTGTNPPYDVSHPEKQILDVLTNYEGSSSAIAQVYKMLLEKVGVTSLVVIGSDEGDSHQFNLIKRGENWSFDDATLGILKADRKIDYFDYDDLKSKKQKAVGIYPVDTFDYIYDKPFLREQLHFKINPRTGFYSIPTNIKATGFNKEDLIQQVRK